MTGRWCRFSQGAACCRMGRSWVTRLWPITWVAPRVSLSSSASAACRSAALRKRGLSKRSPVSGRKAPICRRRPRSVSRERGFLPAWAGLPPGVPGLLPSRAASRSRPAPSREVRRLAVLVRSSGCAGAPVRPLLAACAFPALPCGRASWALLFTAPADGLGVSVAAAPSGGGRTSRSMIRMAGGCMALIWKSGLPGGASGRIVDGGIGYPEAPGECIEPAICGPQLCDGRHEGGGQQEEIDQAAAQSL